MRVTHSTLATDTPRHTPSHSRRMCLAREGATDYIPTTKHDPREEGRQTGDVNHVVFATTVCVCVCPQKRTASAAAYVYTQLPRLEVLRYDVVQSLKGLPLHAWSSIPKHEEDAAQAVSAEDKDVYDPTL